MQSILDQYLGIHTQALTLEAQRMQVLAANLANADTPNYKARDLDFKAALAAAVSGNAAAGGQLALATTHPNDVTSAGSLAGSTNASAAGDAGGATGAPELKYRVPLAPALDGNTVDEQLEQSAFAENSVRYQATLSFLNSKLRALVSALSSS